MTEDEGYWEIPYEETGFQAYDDLYTQIQQVEEDVQSILKLRFFEELKLDEIAQILDMNLSTVKAKLYRGLKKLKIAMGEEAGA